MAEVCSPDLMFHKSFTVQNNIIVKVKKVGKNSLKHLINVSNMLAINQPFTYYT